MKLTQPPPRTAFSSSRNAPAEEVYRAASVAAAPDALQHAKLFYEKKRASCDDERLGAITQQLRGELATRVLALGSAWSVRVASDDGFVGWLAFNVPGCQRFVDRCLTLVSARPEIGRHESELLAVSDLVEDGEPPPGVVADVDDAAPAFGRVPARLQGFARPAL
jgi:hypothetical protein